MRFIDILYEMSHCVKSVQAVIFLAPRIWSKSWKTRTRKNSIFETFQATHKTHFECVWIMINAWDRSSPQKIFLGKGILKIYTKFTGKHPLWSAISMELLCKFAEYFQNILRRVRIKLSIFLIQNHVFIEILRF